MNDTEGASLKYRLPLIVIGTESYRYTIAVDSVYRRKEAHIFSNSLETPFIKLFVCYRDENPL